MRNRILRVGGYLCRIAVIGAATAGISLFFADAMQLELSRSYLTAVSFLAVLLVALFRFSRRTALIGGGCVLGGLVYAGFAFRGTLLEGRYALPALWNACVTRFARSGFVATEDMHLSYSSELSDATLLYIGMTVVVLLFAVLYTCSLLRRVNLIPPAILTTTLLVVLLTFNLFTNQQPSMDIVLLVASFAAVLVLTSYDHAHLPPRHADRQTRRTHDANGGYVAIATLLVCALVLAIPANLVQGKFTTIEPIDRRTAYLRNYLTALLKGDGRELDALSYQGNRDSSRPRYTDAEQLSFTGKEIMYIKAGYDTGYYLTGWIATDYRDGAWYAADTDQLAAYRRLFDIDESPAEELREAFYRAMLPSLRNADPRATLSYRSYGFARTQVSLKRLTDTDANASACYLPAIYAPRYGLLEYDSYSESALSFINYYDGIRTGRAFADEVSYSAVAYVPIMTDPDWAEGLSRLSAQWAALREFSLLQAYLPSDPSDSHLTLSISENDGVTRFTYRSAEPNEEQQAWSFSHPTAQVIYAPSGDVAGDIAVEIGDVTLILRMSGNRIIGATLSMEDESDALSDDERAKLADDASLALTYGDFVYDTYCTPGESELVTAIANLIRAKYMLNDVTAGTREFTSGQAVIERDRVVRDVIRYLTSDGGYQYTLTPDTSAVDASLDGVENFLLNTKQGYCVQFASAAALLLREYGIPVRYVEGYIASGLDPSEDGTTWDGYVHDYEAHAWIEVYYDGIGWIPYETTPAYYDTMYTPSAEPLPPETETSTERETATDTEPVTMPPIQSENETETAQEPTTSVGTTETTETAYMTETDDSSQPPESDTEPLSPTPKPPLSKRLWPLWLLSAAVCLFLYAVWARKRGMRHRRLAERLLHEGCPPEDIRPCARELSDAFYHLLGLYGLSPRVGELPTAYADRLTACLSDKCPQAAIPPMRAICDAIEAEEFGTGMTPDELTLLAEGYLFLHTERRHLCSPARRLYLRLIRHVL